ncbi:MAG TPA: hypothetical protein VGR54_09270 [Nitrosopumilaceae archaeon]|nr:hypothetical protein [Nitrosopumilaceae archaeon]
MARDLLVRGFDDDVYSHLGDIADKMGVSLNSIVKDAVDKWLQQSKQTPKKHNLILYSDDDSLSNLLRSIDRITRGSTLFRIHYGPPTHHGVKTLDSYKWFNATIVPYNSELKNIVSYYTQVKEHVTKTAGSSLVCGMGFFTDDMAHHGSLKKALAIEKTFNTSRLKGFMFCPYKIKDLVSAGIDSLIELFQEHDQIYIQKKNHFYKLHLTEENIHKLFF